MRKIYNYFFYLIILLGINVSPVKSQEKPFTIGTDLVADESIVFPDDAGVIDITKPPYKADNTGETDVTAIIQKVIDDHPMVPGSSTNQWLIVYFPNGIYKVSDAIRWPESHDWSFGPVFQGQNRDSTIFKLEDNSSLFQDPETPRAVLWTGSGVAQKFSRGIRNLTVNTGTGNPGAIGIQFCSNNEGIMDMVDIYTEDGNGVIGLDMGHSWENGPVLVRNVRIYGYNTGIRCQALNSITFSNIFIENQKEVGITNANHVITFENLTSKNTVPAITTEYGYLGIINSTLTGGSSENYAIDNTGSIFARNVTSDGYKGIMLNTAGDKLSPYGNHIVEFTSKPTVMAFDNSSKYSLNMEIKQQPNVTWDNNFENWKNPEEYGAIPDDGIDDTEAIQKAIDSAKTTVYFPYGKYTINNNVIVRGSVSRITGCNTFIDGPGNFIVKDGSSPVVKMERLRRNNQLPFNIVSQTSRTLIVESSLVRSVVGEGSGDIFISDVLTYIDLRDPDQHVYLRHLNTEALNEGYEANVLNNGSNMWLLGLKVEKFGIKVKTTNNGTTEIIGAHIYPQCTPKTTPLFVDDNSTVSIANMRETNHCNPPATYDIYVQEIVDGVTEDFLKTETNSGGWGSGKGMILYTGFKGEANPAMPPAAPTSLSATQLSANEMQLTWNDNAVNEDGYVIEYRNIGGDFAHIDSVEPGNSYIHETSFPSFTVLEYRIRAFNEHGSSPWSPYAEVITMSSPSDILQQVNHMSINISKDNEGNIQVENRTVETVYFNLYTITGRKVNEGILEPGNTRLKSNSFQKGVYILRITGKLENRILKTEKIVF